MGTRADFWIGTDPATMEWLGSIAWDGYPSGIDAAVLEARDKEEYEIQLGSFLFDRDDVTRPEDGWPWPWKNSYLTDFAYTFDGERVLCSCFGSPWQVAMEFEDAEDESHQVEFPDMTGVKSIAWGKRSGLIVVHARTDGSVEIE